MGARHKVRGAPYPPSPAQHWCVPSEGHTRTSTHTRWHARTHAHAHAERAGSEAGKPKHQALRDTKCEAVKHRAKPHAVRRKHSLTQCDTAEQHNTQCEATAHTQCDTPPIALTNAHAVRQSHARTRTMRTRTMRGTLDTMRKRKHMAQPKWSEDERQSFADGVRLRASTVPDARKAQSKRACRLWRRHAHD